MNIKSEPSLSPASPSYSTTPIVPSLIGRSPNLTSFCTHHMSLPVVYSILNSYYKVARFSSVNATRKETSDFNVLSLQPRVSTFASSSHSSDSCCSRKCCPKCCQIAQHNAKHLVVLQRTRNGINGTMMTAINTNERGGQRVSNFGNRKPSQLNVGLNSSLRERLYSKKSFSINNKGFVHMIERERIIQLIDDLVAQQKK